MGGGKPSPDTCLSVYFLITRYSQKTPFSMEKMGENNYMETT